jgi:AcrR family transcriptional regulator
VARSVKPRRKYNRTGRAQAAGATRDALGTAARRLFRERGFAGTTIEAIAAEAGYAPQTVYFHFGTKAAILRHLVEQAKSELVIPLYQRSLVAEDPRKQLALAVQIGRFGAEAGWDLVEVLGSARDEPEFQELVRGLEGEKQWGIGNLVASLANRGHLRHGLSEGQAVDLLMVLTSGEVFRMLVIQRGWSPNDYEAWLVAALQRELLQSGSPGDRPASGPPVRL